MTRPEFDTHMSRMRGLRFPPATMDTHWEGLRDIPVGRLDAAVSVAIRTRVEFPTPSELRADCDATRPQEGPSLPQGDEILAEPIPLGVLPDGTRLPAAQLLWRYYDDKCSDTGWQSVWCGDPATNRQTWIAVHGPCGRFGEHPPHEYVRRCQCWDSNPKLIRDRERMRSYAKDPAPVRGRR